MKFEWKTAEKAREEGDYFVDEGNCFKALAFVDKYTLFVYEGRPYGEAGQLWQAPYFFWHVFEDEGDKVHAQGMVTTLETARKAAEHAVEFQLTTDKEETRQR